MANENKELVEKDHPDSLRNEYSVVAANWRLLAGLRFALLAFSVTLFSVLQGAYGYLLANKKKFGELELIGNTAFWIIPIFGIVTSAALFLIENRTRILCQPCVSRAKRIEEILTTEVAQFYLFDISRRPLFRFVSHTRGIWIIYGSMLTVWAFLLGLSIVT